MLKIKTIQLHHSQEFMLTIGNFNYLRIADFSVDPDLLLKWGRKRLITEDIFGNYIVYWKERFPLFDAFDRESEDRHYRVIVFCNSLSDAQTKLSLLQKDEISITQFGSNNESINALFHDRFAKLLPYVYCEDKQKLVLVHRI